jgi:hypothetical protein
MASVKGFDTVVPVVQVTQGSLGIDAFTNTKSFEVHELAGGKVCAIALVRPNKLTNREKSTLLLSKYHFLRFEFCDCGLKKNKLGICKPDVEIVFFGDTQHLILLDRTSKSVRSVILSMIIKF